MLYPIRAGKAGFFLRYPNSWVKAMDRPGGEKGETLALVGNFKDIDTVSIRREPLDLHEDFVSAAAGYSSEEADGAEGRGRLSIYSRAPHPPMSYYF